MKESGNLADAIAASIGQRVEAEAKRRKTTTGTVTRVDADGTIWCDMGDGATPCEGTTATVVAGDTVSVTVEDGHATVTGNLSRPSTDDTAANAALSRVTVVETENQVISGKLEAAEASIGKLSAEDAEIRTLVAGKADVQELTAAKADIADLKAKDVEIEGNISAASARIGDIEADYLKAEDMEAEEARVDNLLANKANVSDLTAATGRIGTLETDNVSVKKRLTAAEGDIDTLEADNVTVKGKLTAAEGEITNLKSSKADISVLESNYITADAIDATYMHANMSNSDVAWISNGVIANGAISSAMINDVSANKLTAGTINGSVINVTNLNADNITTGTINGQRIGEGSLSLDKLSEDVYTEAEVDAKLSTMQAEIDGAIETWTGTDVPTLNNTPASNWTDSATRDTHVGDVYFVVNSESQQNGYNYRFTKTGSTYSWQLIKDTDITNALKRIADAEGEITQFDSDISTLKTETGTLKTKTQSLETSLGDKVDVTTFSEVSETVDSHSESISQMTETLSNKADGSTVTSLTNRVNKTETDISGINTTIGELQTTVESKADGSTVETISSKLNSVENTVEGHAQTISSVQSTLATKADNTTVQTLREEYNETKTTVAGTVTKLASVEQTANGVRSDLDNLEIGGRNLLRNTAVARTGTASTYGAWDIIKPTYSNPYLLDLDKGEYVLSFDWESDAELPGNFYVWIGYGNTAGNGAAEMPGSYSTPFFGKGETSGHAVRRFTWPDANDTYPYFACRPIRDATSNNLNGITFTITNAKLEKGNMATDWTPAPEDMEVEVTSLKSDYAEYKQTTTEALSEIGTTYATKDELSTETNTRETAIKQVNDAISLKANSSDVYTKTQTDGLISTEVTNRNAAIEAKADAINLSVSEIRNRDFDFENLMPNARTMALGAVDPSTGTWCLAGNSTMTRSRVEIEDGPFGSCGAFQSVGTQTETDASCFGIDSFPLTEGEQYRMSLYARAVSGTGYAGIQQAPSTGYARTYIDSNATYTWGGNYQCIELTSSWQKVWVEFEAEANAANLYIGMAGTDATIQMCMVSLQVAKTSHTELASAKAEIKVTTDGISSEVSKVSSAKYVTSTSTSWTLSGIKTWAAEGYSEPWNVQSTEGLRNGDTVYVCGTDNTRNCKVYIKTTVTSVESTTRFTGTSHGYEDVLPVETIKSTINQSSDSVKIQANHVEIDGTAIFTAISSDVDDAITDKGYQTSSQVENAITSKGYATTGQVATAKSEAITSANSNTDTKLASYSTTQQMNIAIGDAVDAIEVGGRNMVTSDDRTGGKPTDAEVSYTRGGNLCATNVMFEDRTLIAERTGDTSVPYTVENVMGAEVTLSFEHKLLDGGTSRGVDVYPYQTTGLSIASSKSFTPTEEWQKFSMTTHVKRWTTGNGSTSRGSAYSPASASDSSYRTNGSIWVYDYAGTNNYAIRNLKIERGNKATDWTPAPEDTDAAIAAVKTTADAAAPKANAVNRTQRIWYRKSASGAPSTPGTASSNWVTKADDGDNAWTKMHVAISSSAKYIYTCEQYEMANGTVGYTDVLLDNTITVIDGGTIITGSVTANQLSANAVTAGKVAAGAITARELKLWDSNNYSQLNDDTAEYWGFTADTTADGHWYTMNTTARDKFVSRYYDCKGGEKFRITFEISTSAKGSATQSAAAAYVGTAIGLYGWNDAGTSVGISYTTRTTGSDSAPTTAVDSVCTIASAARRFRVFVQTEAYYNFSGTIKIRNLKVYRMAGADLIVDGAITADKIAANAITIGSVSGLQTQLDGKADDSDIPTKVSDLTNDSGFQNATQVSSTVSNAVKDKADKSEIPTTVAELTDSGDYAKSDDIPTKVSELANDSSFATTGEVATAQAAATNAANQATDQKLTSYSTTAVADTLYDPKGAADDALDDAKDYVDGKGYQTASDVSQAISTGTANLAAKADAIARTQRIWYRQTASGAKPGKNLTWLSTSGTGYGNWSLTVPQLTSGSTKYPKLYTAVQSQTVAQQAAGTACSCSDVMLDDSTTVIDGGTIITGSVSANAVNASSGTFDVANIPNLSAAKITSGTIDSARINASSLVVGSSTLGTVLDGKADDSDIPTKVSQLSNDSSFATTGQVSTAKSEAISAAATDATSKANAAAQTATNYLTTISGTSGISVHDAGDTSNYVNVSSGLINMVVGGVSRLKAFVENSIAKLRVGIEDSGHALFTPDGMEVFTDSTTSVASFGETARVGKASGARAEISSSGMDVYMSASTRTLRMTTAAMGEYVVYAQGTDGKNGDYAFAYKANALEEDGYIVWQYTSSATWLLAFPAGVHYVAYNATTDAFYYAYSLGDWYETSAVKVYSGAVSNTVPVIEGVPHLLMPNDLWVGGDVASYGDVTAAGTITGGIASNFATTSHVIVNASSVTAGGYLSGTVALSKSGYTPISVAGQTSDQRYVSFIRAYISDAADGSGSLNWMVYNPTSSAKTPTMRVYVLWAKS